MSEEATGGTVSSSLSLGNAQRITDEEWKQLGAMRSIGDEEIDLSDIPAQADVPSWSRPGLFGGPVGVLRAAAMREKVLILDEDVAASLKDVDDATPTKLNAVLREYAETHRRTA